MAARTKKQTKPAAEKISTEDKLKIILGWAITGSFCTFSAIFKELKNITHKVENIVPIMSEVSQTTDTRFGKAKDFIRKFEELTEKKIIKSIENIEPIGPQKLLDVLLIAPCTGNTLAKISNGIADSLVTFAAKAHLRNEKPLVISVSSNDALSSNFLNIATLINKKNVYFVPFGQDDPINKKSSLVADVSKIFPTIIEAQFNRQIQPIII